MSEFYKWDPARLSVSVQEMDDEHIILINKMNALYAANSEGKPKVVLSGCVQDLKNYTIKHFSNEEAYMASIKYSGLPTHKLVHADLIKKLGEYAAQFENSGVFSHDFFQFLSIWLTAHIRGIDTKYSKTAITR